MKLKPALRVVPLILTVIWGWAQDNPPDSDSVARTAGKDNVTFPASKDPKLTSTLSLLSPYGPSYVIGVGDILHISVWKEPDLTATLPVRSDGMVSMALLNDVLAAGMTPMQLSALLTQKLKQYIATPRVTVVVTQANPRWIYVVGEVSHTGPVPLVPNMTILQAIATTGFTQFANTKKIYVLRTDNGQEQKIPFNYNQVIRGEKTSQNILLRPGDTVVVP